MYDLYNSLLNLINGGGSAPVYPDYLIPFGDGVTAGGITDAGLRFDPSSNSFVAGDLGAGSTIGISLVPNNESAGFNVSTPSFSGGSGIIPTYTFSSFTTPNGATFLYLGDAGFSFYSNYVNGLSRMELNSASNVFVVSDFLSDGIYFAGSASTGITPGSVKGLAIDILNDVYTLGNPTTNQLTIKETVANLKSCPAYDDDAAAATAGLVTGDIYQTTGSGAITTAGVLMIKQ